MGLIEIDNGTVAFGVLPSLGGRVVLLRRSGGENLLDSDPARWRPPFPPPALETAFEPWNGRILWVGPQSGFWSQQDLRPDLRQKHAVWPPDPFNETARFEVVERAPDRLRLAGPPSPVTGLAFEHEYAIVGGRQVLMKTRATNRRATPVSWDLWPNTRVRPDGFAYAPVDADRPPRFDQPKPDDPVAGPCPSEVRDGWLALPPGLEPQAPRQRLWTKAFVQPPRGLIAFFRGRDLLLIRATPVPARELHPEQAFVELYRGAGAEGAVLELEMHGPYLTLAPGARMSFEQTFELLDYDGPAEAPAHRRRLEALAP